MRKVISCDWHQAEPVTLLSDAVRAAVANFQSAFCCHAVGNMAPPFRHFERLASCKAAAVGLQGQ